MFSSLDVGRVLSFVCVGGLMFDDVRSYSRIVWGTRGCLGLSRIYLAKGLVITENQAVHHRELLMTHTGTDLFTSSDPVRLAVCGRWLLRLVVFVGASHEERGWPTFFQVSCSNDGIRTTGS